MKHKSKSVSKPAANRADPLFDTRVRKTRAKIDGAFVKLLFQRSYRDLRVSDITRKAVIGRATFYAHFSSKDELLTSQVKRVFMPMLKANPGSSSLVDCRELFAHVRTAPQLFHAIMSEGEGSGRHIVHAAMEARMDKLLAESKPVGGSLPPLLVKRFVLSTLLTIMAHGMQPGATDSAEAMQNQFDKLVSSGLSA